MIRAIEDEYWAYQYKTHVMGYEDQTWWPLEGSGYYGSKEVAAEAARASGYLCLRLVHIERKRRFVDIPEAAEEES